MDEVIPLALTRDINVATDESGQPRTDPLLALLMNQDDEAETTKSEKGKAAPVH